MTGRPARPVVSRTECPTCHFKVRRTAAGPLAYHHVQGPGVGIICPGDVDAT